MDYQNKSFIRLLAIFCILWLAFENNAYGRPNDPDSVLFSGYIGQAASPVAHEGGSDTFRIDTYNGSWRAGTDRVGAFDSLVIDSIQIISYTPGTLPLVAFKFKSISPWGPFGPKTTDTICTITNSSVITNNSGKFMIDNDVAGGEGFVTDIAIESQSPNTMKNDSIHAGLRFVARRLFVWDSPVPPIFIYDTLYVEGIQNSTAAKIQFYNNRAAATVSEKHLDDDRAGKYDLNGRVITCKSNRSGIVVANRRICSNLKKY